MDRFKIGSVLRIRHARKGTFDVRLEKVEANMITGTIVAGTARYVSKSDRSIGDRIVIPTNKSFIEIKEMGPVDGRRER